MALTATFTADLARFDSAIRNSTSELRTFDRTTSTTVGSVRAKLSGLSDVFGAFGGALSIGAVVAFGKSMLDAADATVKLSDKTGIAIEPLQRLKYIAEQSGNSIDQVTRAVSQMQNRLAEGDKSAVGAVTALGLSLSNLKSLSPDQQFIAIAREIAKIEDPMLRTKLAMDLFGRAGSEILPTLIADVDKLGDQAVVMSDKATKAFDAIGDAIGRAWGTGKNTIGEAIGSMVDGYGRLAQASTALVTGDWGRIPEIMADVVAVTAPMVKSLELSIPAMKGVALSVDGIDRAERSLTDTYKKNADALKEQARALTEAGDKMVRWNDELRRNADEVRRDAIAMDIWKTKFDAALGVDSAKLVTAAENLNRLNDAFRASVRDISGSTLVPFKAVVEAVPSTPEWVSAWEPMRKGFQGVLETLPQTLQAAFTGGGGLMGALKAIGVQIASVLAGSISDAITKALAGRAAASLIGGTGGGSSDGPSSGSIAKYAAYATVIGAAAYGIFKVVQHNRHLNDEVKAANIEIEKLRAGLLETYGPLDQLEAKAQALGLSFVAAWGHQGEGGLKAFTEHIKEFERRLAFADEAFAPLLQSAKDLGVRLPDSILLSIQSLRDLGIIVGDNARLLDDLAGAAEVDWKKMEEAGARYGDWIKTELGGTFNQLKSNDFAKQMINDFDLLTRGGADVGSVLFGMKEEISKLVMDAKKFGLDIPANMKPWITELDRAGLLTDENGKKLEDIGDLKFADPIKTEFEKITGALKDLIAMLGELAGAIRNLPKPDFGLPTVPGGGGGGGDIDFGPTPGAPLAFARGGGGGPQTIHVPVALDGRVITEVVLERMGNRYALRGG